MKRIFTGLLILVALLAVGLFVMRGQIAVAVMKRASAHTMSQDVIRDLPDGLHAAICGSGAPLPDADRAGPCTAIIAGKRLFVVDAGESAARTMGRMGVGSANSLVLLTHFHSDHIDGLGNLSIQRWVGMSATTPLEVHGPAGVERVVAGFNEAYALDAGYRTAHHGPVVAPPAAAGMVARPFTFADGADSVVVLDEDGVKITAFRVDHGPVEPAVGYRFDYKGRSLVVSGDTSASPNLTRQATGVDLLIHEALAPNLVAILHDGALAAGSPNRAKIFADIPDYHTSPEAVAGIAKAAGVKALLLTHILPPLPIKALEGPFLGDSRKIYSGPLWIARDGDLISLPAGGSDITRKNLLH
ncbi:MAG: MBL fold metallo-hydrolase [Caulobacter sp.]|nr:MBL fold metallo-hydrolase [Caulobacter sp.]